MFQGSELTALLEGLILQTTSMSGERRSAKPGNQVWIQRIQISSCITCFEHKQKLIQVPPVFMHQIPTCLCSAVTLCAYPESQNMKQIQTCRKAPLIQ